MTCSQVRFSPPETQAHARRSKDGAIAYAYFTAASFLRALIARDAERLRELGFTHQDQLVRLFPVAQAQMQELQFYGPERLRLDAARLIIASNDINIHTHMDERPATPRRAPCTASLFRAKPEGMA